MTLTTFYLPIYKRLFAVFLALNWIHIYKVSLIAGLEYGMVEWKMEWNSECTQLPLTSVTGAA